MHENCKNTILAKTLKTSLPSRRNAYFQGFETLNLKDGFENAFKNHVFFGISIWKGFGEGFGRVLGHQNPRFSRFFRCFLEVIFEARSGGVKNRPERPPRAEIDTFCLRFPVIPPLLGREKERGSRA